MMWQTIQRLALNFIHYSDPRKTWRWMTVRGEWIKKHPRCCICGRKAEQVHHIVPVHVDANRAFDNDNLLSSCTACHLVWLHMGNYRKYVVNVAAMVDRCVSLRTFAYIQH